ncbi:MAG: tyrosine recombinase [Verrucomicrobiae bacterium]|nr:tyrosine recombinase [Verrucomicrobiae bacterium]
MPRPPQESLDPVPPGFRAPIEAYLLHRLTERGLAKSTVQQEARILSHCARWMQGRQVETWGAVTPALLHEFLAWRQKKLQSTTYQNQLIELRLFYRFAAQEFREIPDLMEHMPTPRAARKVPGTLTQSDLDQILTTPTPQTPCGWRDRAILELLYASGMRRAEVLGLQLHELDMDEGVARVTGKGAKTRVVPVGKKAVEALQTYLSRGRPALVRARTGSAVFLNRFGAGLSTMGLLNIVRAQARRAGLDRRVYPHLLRHSFATHLLEEGADLRVIQEMLGHANITTTEIYTHVDRQHLKEEHRKFHPRSGK